MKLRSRTIIGNVHELATQWPDKVFCRLVVPGQATRTITYGELWQKAGDHAAFLRAKGVAPGEVVIVLLKHGAELVFAYVGTLFLGAIPSVFAFPSVKVTPEVYRETLSTLLGVCGSRFVLTYAEVAALIAGDAAMAKICTPLVAHDVQALAPTPPLAVATPGETDVAILQHSSGTTGLKKGVALSNAAVINQVEHYALAIGLTPDDRIVSWLPLYHDMGLIACFVLPLVTGTRLTLISPFDWVARPELLVQQLHEERGTLCWLPNFAYNFLAQRVADDVRDACDLSSVRAFINCSEPIHATSHEMFRARFEGCGVRGDALASCYAMAENTFAVTQSPIGAPAKSEEIDWLVFTSEQRAVAPGAQTQVRKTMVSSGRAIAGNRIRIVDDEGRELGERRMGEICIQSDSLFSGYYHRPELTALCLKDGWYATGDLGYLAAGELFVTGRKKDLIIISGKNVYPQDIEALVSAVDGIYPGRVVAFGIDDEAAGTQIVVVVAELKEPAVASPLQLKLAIAKTVRDNLECVVHEVCLVPHQWLVKSTAGKISRSRNLERYLNELKGA